MKIKVPLLILASAGLCSCAALSESSFDGGSARAPGTPLARSMLTNPRTYMDQDDPDLQKLLERRTPGSGR